MTNDDRDARDGVPEYLGEPAGAWIDRLRSDDPLLRRSACHALGMIGPNAVERAAEALAAVIDGDPEPFVRAWAAEALVRVAPGDCRALGGLCAALHAEQGFVRSLGAWFLGRVGPRLETLEEAVEGLERLGADPDPSVRAEAELAIRILRDKHTKLEL